MHSVSPTNEQATTKDTFFSAGGGSHGSKQQQLLGGVDRPSAHPTAPKAFSSRFPGEWLADPRAGTDPVVRGARPKSAQRAGAMRRKASAEFKSSVTPLASAVIGRPGARAVGTAGPRRPRKCQGNVPNCKVNRARRPDRPPIRPVRLAAGPNAASPLEAADAPASGFDCDGLRCRRGVPQASCKCHFGRPRPAAMTHRRSRPRAHSRHCRV